MRVITGSARGRRLGELKGMETRPTTDKVKESIFNCIQFDVEDARVLDLFAGTGQLGIEALSRGAKSALFVDKRADAVKLVRENLALCHLEENAQVICGDSLAALGTQSGRSTSSSSIRRTKADFWSRRWKRSRSLTFYHPMV